MVSVDCGELRPYQRKAVDDVISHFGRGKARVVLVSPTGSGKTRMASAIGRRALSAGKTAAGVVHRRELVQQLRDIGIPCYTAQSRYTGVKVDLLIVDECHHYTAEQWGRWLQAGAYIVGLTATPERGDGQTLADAFDELVVAADYPELISEGYLMDAVLKRPAALLGEGLAMDPVDALRKFRPGGARAFVYCNSVSHGSTVAREMCMAGYPAVMISGGTPADFREASLDSFRRGKLSVLVNVHVLTEGVNVPEADTCIIARGVTNPTTYLQMVGRILRPHPGKVPMVIDLPGCSWSWGQVNEPRVYDLARGIRLQKSIPVYECPRCGWAQHERISTCARCEWVATTERGQKPPPIYSQELREVWDAENTPQAHKDKELDRLLTVARRAGYSLSWVVDKYKQTFGDTIVLKVSKREKDEQLAEWCRIQKERGYKRKWPAVQYKRTFGHYPPGRTSG